MAVNAADVATPEASVSAVVTPPANVPEAPEPGAVKVTVTFGTGLFPESLTRAFKGPANKVLMEAVCGDPLCTEIELGTLDADTVTFAVALVRPEKLAVMTAEPTEAPVTGTATVVAPAVMLTEDGTVAEGALEDRVKERPPTGAGADRFRVRFCVLPVLIARVAGVKLIVAVTVTVFVPVV